MTLNSAPFDGKLYIMARAVSAADGLGSEQSWMELISGWQASIGKAVLQSWGFAEEMCDAVGDQDDVDPAAVRDPVNHLAGQIAVDARHLQRGPGKRIPEFRQRRIAQPRVVAP